MKPMSNVDDLIKRLKREKTEPEKIHEELFQTTSEYQYYLFGVAQGLYFLYKALNEYNNREIILTNSELMQVIRVCANEDEKIKENFIRLLKDIN